MFNIDQGFLSFFWSNIIYPWLTKSIDKKLINKKDQYRHVCINIHIHVYKKVYVLKIKVVGLGNSCPVVMYLINYFPKNIKNKAITTIKCSQFLCCDVPVVYTHMCREIDRGQRRTSEVPLHLSLF